MSPNNEIKNGSINVSPSNSSATFSMNSKEDELFNEPLQPVWPENVFIFKPTDSAESIKAQIKPTEDPSETFDLNGSTISYHNSKHHFDTKHYALLFTPGTYEDCAFEVGYYVGMAGLGKNAKDVVFKGKSGPYVEALNKDIPVTDGGSIAHDGSGLCLDTFWRSAENFTTEHMKWAVSQAAPLRRVHILNTLQFGDGEAYSSGGFLANAKIENTCNFIANQQWFSRGVEFQGDVQGGAWSRVFSGCHGKGIPAPNSWEGTPYVGPITTIEKAPEVRVEKPFIVMGDFGNFELHVPKATSTHTVGSDLETGDHIDIRSFNRVKVCQPYLPHNAKGEYVNHPDETYNEITNHDKDLTDSLQKALDEGKDLLLCPGIFFLTKPLIVRYKDQVILGLGLPVLVAPQDGSPCIRVMPKTEGVRIAGVTLEASFQVKDSFNNSGLANSDGVRSLLEVGEPNVYDAGNPLNPVLLSDLFTRVGGSNPERSTVFTDVMVRIHSGNVVGDNLWLWRADHVKLRDGETANDERFKDYHQTRIWETNDDGEKVKVNECVAKNAIYVSGDDVKMYGLFCEHTTEHQCVWKGERGVVRFFQCELPYDVDIDFTNDNYTGYYVDEHVEEHSASAVGVYCNFQCFQVHPQSGIRLPSKPGIVLENPFTCFLSNNGSIRATVQQGDAIVGTEVVEKNKRSHAWLGKKRALVHLS